MLTPFACQRLRSLLNLPHRFELKEAIVGTITINLPANLLFSGAVEISINDVSLAVHVLPPPRDQDGHDDNDDHDDASTSTPSPPPTPRPGDRAAPALDPEEFPSSAEDLAESFLHLQSQAEKQQLMSLYAEAPMASSVMSSASSISEDGDADLGVGMSIGLPGVLASMFKGIADRMIVRIRGTRVAVETHLPEDRGGERVHIELEVEDVDMEAVSRNVSAAASLEGHQRPQKEGKRRITLENIQGFVMAPESVFGMGPDEAGSVAFGGAGAASEAPTERGRGGGGHGNGADEISHRHTDHMDASKSTIRSPPSPLRSPPAPTQPVEPGSPQPPPPPPTTTATTATTTTTTAAAATGSGSGEGDGVNLRIGEGKLADFGESDDEELAFAPPTMRTSTRRSFYRHPSHSFDYTEHGESKGDDDDDSDDDTEGGALFSPSIPQHQRRSPSASIVSAPFASPASSPPVTQPVELAVAPPTSSPAFPDHPSPALSDPGDDSSGDEMDQEASRMLSQSTIFSSEEAGSLYMSANSRVLRSQSELQTHQGHDEDGSRDGGGAEEVDPNEIDRKLDWLMGADDPFARNSPHRPETASGRSETSKSAGNQRTLRKKCLDIDLVTIYYPSISDGVAVAVDNQSQISPPPPLEETRGHRQQDMPGAFSMYASRHTPRSPLTAQFATPASPPHRPPPRVKIVESMDARPTAPSVQNILGDSSSTKVADIEIIASKIHGTVDVHTERMLAHVLETVQTIFAEEDQEPAKKKRNGMAPPQHSPKKTVQLVAEEIDVRMIKHLGGFYTDNAQEDVADKIVLLQCLLNDVKVFHKGLPEEASTSRLSVKKFALKDEEEGIITFLRNVTPPNSSAKMSTSHHRKRSSTGATAGRLLGNSSGDDDDITVVFSRSSKKVRVNIVTQPLKIRGNLKRLEETFGAFGGVGSVLASTTASTATIGKAERPSPPGLEDGTEIFGMDVKVDCRLGGLIFDVVGTNAKVSLEASPVKIRFQSGKGVAVNIDKINISGPIPGRSDASLVIEGTAMEFASRPTQEDLSRLLELLTPSKDSFDDDDILIGTLLRQREQGSVLRINVAGVRGELLDVNIFDPLKGLGDEVIQVLSITDFVAGDERPGLLTLVNVGAVYAYAEVGGGIGRVEAEMESIGISHVTAPSLFAMALRTISVRRNDHEELVGEGIDRHTFSSSEYDRPMVMVRMVGEEPEPVVKIKLWNFRVEYSVNVLMAIMESPSGTTADELAQEMVESIVTLPLKQEVPSDCGEVLGIDLVIKDSVLALNPLDLKSRGLVVLSDSRLQAALPIGGRVTAGMEVKRASIMVIDDVEHLLGAESRQPGGRREALSDHLAGFLSMGYVPMVTISSATVALRVVDKTVDLEIRDDLLVIESCADSTQTMLAIFNGLKPPAAESEEIRYCTEVVPMDLLASLTEDAFSHPGRKKPTAMENDDEEELLQWDEDLPTNLAFVESYYGHKTPPVHPSEALADSMLEEDLAKIRSPSLSQEGSASNSVFKENIVVLDPRELKWVDDHFGKATPRRRGKRSLNQTAVEKYAPYPIPRFFCVKLTCGWGLFSTEYFPLRIRIRDVHAIFNMHDGYDWQRTRDTISHAVRKLESKAAERRNRRVSFDIEDDDESVVDDFLFNSIYIGISSNRAPGDLTNDINKHFDDQLSETSYATTADSARPLSSRSRSTVTGDHRNSRSGKRLKLSRSRNHKIQFELKGVNVDFWLFPPESKEVQSSVDVRVRDLEIFDNVPTSTWKKFVTYCQDCGDRQVGSDMVRLECMVVKPVPELAATELVLKVKTPILSTTPLPLACC